MNNIFTHTNWLWASFLISASLLLGALGFEHIGGMAPCTMCYWQRHAHKAVLILAILGLLIHYISKGGKWNKAFVILIGAAFTVSFGLAFWHTGVEYKWWEGPKTCAAGPSPTNISADDIFKALEEGVKGPACGDVPWSLFGISMAGYNALVSIGSALLSFGIAFKRR